MHAKGTTRQDMLNCGGCGPWPNRGGREKEPIDAEILPVHGKVTLVSLPYACLAAGLLDDVRGDRRLGLASLLELAQAKWGKSVDRFMADAAKVGVSPDSLERRARAVGGAIIGWNGGAPCPTGICSDLELTLAILSRCIGDMFISDRPPEYAWDGLFTQLFQCDEDLGPAPSRNQPPWQQYPWEDS